MNPSSSLDLGRLRPRRRNDQLATLPDLIQLREQELHLARQLIPSRRDPHHSRRRTGRRLHVTQPLEQLTEGRHVAEAYDAEDCAGAALNEPSTAQIAPAVGGHAYLNPQLGVRVATEPEFRPATPDQLSGRELELLRLLALGYTNAEIADAVFLGVRTVESHRSHIQCKTGRRSRAELVAFALEYGLLGPKVIG